MKICRTYLAPSQLSVYTDTVRVRLNARVAKLGAIPSGFLRFQRELYMHAVYRLNYIILQKLYMHVVHRLKYIILYGGSRYIANFISRFVRMCILQ